MPIIHSAIKKMRKDAKRTKINKAFSSTLKAKIKEAKNNKDAKTFTQAVSYIDKAVKKHLLKKNTASRLKSHLAKQAKTGKAGSGEKRKTTKAKKTVASV